MSRNDTKIAQSPAQTNFCHFWTFLPLWSAFLSGNPVQSMSVTSLLLSKSFLVIDSVPSALSMSLFAPKKDARKLEESPCRGSQGKSRKILPKWRRYALERQACSEPSVDTVPAFCDGFFLAKADLFRVLLQEMRERILQSKWLPWCGGAHFVCEFLLDCNLHGCSQNLNPCSQGVLAQSWRSKWGPRA